MAAWAEVASRRADEEGERLKGPSVVDLAAWRRASLEWGGGGKIGRRGEEEEGRMAARPGAQRRPDEQRGAGRRRSWESVCVCGGRAESDAGWGGTG